MTELSPALKCCDTHDGWGDLAEHLITLFPDVRAGEVVDVLQRARDAAEEFGLPEDERLQTVEIMVRYQLMQLSGQMPTAARLDPENHQRAFSATTGRRRRGTGR
jgi:hypothetical protein